MRVFFVFYARVEVEDPKYKRIETLLTLGQGFSIGAVLIVFASLTMELMGSLPTLTESQVSTFKIPLISATI